MNKKLFIFLFCFASVNGIYAAAADDTICFRDTIHGFEFTYKTGSFAKDFPNRATQGIWVERVKGSSKGSSTIYEVYKKESFGGKSFYKKIREEQNLPPDVEHYLKIVQDYLTVESPEYKTRDLSRTFILRTVDKFVGDYRTPVAVGGLVTLLADVWLDATNSSYGGRGFA